VRFLIDAPLSPETARWLTAQGHDAVHVEARGLLRAPDEDILRAAAKDDRLVITMDLDFPELLATKALRAPGVILIRLSFATTSHLHERLTALLQAIDPDSLTETVTVLEDLRFRIRKLPIM